MVICDTNIWYGIGSGAIGQEEFSGHSLACTFVSLHELATSKNLYKNFNSVKKAVQAINQHADIMLYTNPVNYTLGKVQTTGGENYWTALQRTLNIQELVIPEKDILLLDIEHDKMNSDYHGAINEMNRIALQVRANIRKDNLVKSRRSEDTTTVTKRLLLGFIQSYTGENIETLDTHIQWDVLQLIVHALSSFMKDIELTKQKIDPNDWHDIFNLVYVGSEDRYWTKENQWNRIISANPVTSKYLFHPN